MSPVELLLVISGNRACKVPCDCPPICADIGGGQSCGSVWLRESKREVSMNWADGMWFGEAGVSALALS